MHVEAFYRFRINDNISITPGFFWLTAPNHYERNPDVVIGVVRTSFAF
nr:carbohydrate porin [Microseira wollei]